MLRRLSHVLLCVVVVGTVTPSVDELPIARRPRRRHLWEQFPLDPKPSSTTTASDGEPRSRSPDATRSNDSGGGRGGQILLVLVSAGIGAFVIYMTLRVRGRLVVIERQATRVDPTPGPRGHARRPGPPALGSSRAAGTPTTRAPTPPPTAAHTATASARHPEPVSPPSPVRARRTDRPHRAEAPPNAAPLRDPAPARPAKHPDLSRDAVPYRDGSAGGSRRSPPRHRDPAPAVSAAHGGEGHRSTADGPPADAPVRRCAIRFARLWGRARFLVVAVLADSAERVVACSQEFPCLARQFGPARGTLTRGLRPASQTLAGGGVGEGERDGRGLVRSRCLGI